MATILPLVPDSLDQSFGIVVDNGPDQAATSLQFRVYWNVRLRGWYFDMSDSDGVGILNGQRLVAGSAFRFPGEVPPGGLVVFGPDVYVEADLGVALQMWYVQPDELVPAETYRMTLGP